MDDRARKGSLPAASGTQAAEPKGFGEVRLRSITRGPAARPDPSMAEQSEESFSEGKMPSPVKHESRLQAMREQLLRERLLAYCEDLAEWFATLFQMPIGADSFGHDIESGVLLNKLARLIEVGEKKGTRGYASGHNRKIACPPAPMDFTEKPTTAFHKRDNVSRFIEWVRKLGVDEAVLFEADDLVGHKNEKNVLYSLMELARVQNGVEPPRLVQLERLIDSGQLAFGTEAEERNAIKLIRDVLHRIEYHDDRVERRGPGRYDIADLGELTIGILRTHVLVRLQNSWDTLEHYILSQSGRPRKATITAPATPAPMQPKNDELERLRKLLQEREAQIAQLEKALQEAQRSRNEADDRTAELDAERSALREMQRELIDKIAKLEGKVALYGHTEAEKDEMLQHIENIERDIATKEREAADRAKLIEDLKRKLEDAELDLEEQEQKAIEDRVKDAGEAAVKYQRMENDLRQRIGELEQQLADAESDGHGRDEELSELRKALKSALARSAELAEQTRAQAEQVAALEDELARLRARIRELEEQLREANRQLEEARAELERQRKQIQDLQRDLQDEREARRDLEQQTKDLGERMAANEAALKKRLEDLQRDSGSHAEQLEEDLRKAREAAKNREAELAARAKANEEQQRQEAEEAIERLKRQLDDAKRDHHEATRSLGDVGRTVDDSKRRIAELEAQLAKAKQALADLEAERQQDAAKSADAQRALRREKDEAQRAHEDEKRDLEDRLASEAKVNAALSKQLEDAANQRLRQEQDSAAKAAAYEDQIRGLKDRMDDHKTRAEGTLNAFAAELASKAEEHELKLKQADAEARKLRAELQAAQDELAAAQDRLAAAGKANDDLKGRLQNAQRTGDDKDANIDQLTAKVNQLQAKLQQAEQQAAQLDDELKSTTGKLDDAEVALAASKREKQGLQADLEDSEAREKDAAKRIKDLEDQLKAVQAASAARERDFAQQLEDALASASGSQRDYSAKLNDLAQQLRDAQQQNHDQADKIHELETKLQSEARKNAGLTGRLQEVEDGALAQQRQLAKEIDDLKKQLREEKAKALSLQDGIDSAQDALRRASAAKDAADFAAKSREAALQQAVADADDRVAQLDRALKQAQAEIARLSSAEQQSSEGAIALQRQAAKEIEDLKKQLRDEKANAAALQDDLGQAQDATRRVSAAKDSAERAAQDRAAADEAKMAAADARIAQLERALKQAQAELDRLAGVERANQDLLVKAKRPPVVVPPAIINSDRSEAELFTEPQLEIVARVNPRVAAAMQEREARGQELAAAEQELQAAAQAMDTNPTPVNADRLEQAKAMREAVGHPFADADWAAREAAKRAVEDLRHEQLSTISQGRAPPSGEAYGVPPKGIASADAVVRICELEQMLLDGTSEADRLQSKVRELEGALAQPPERDDLRVYRENIAEWINALLGTPMTEKNLMPSLQDGKILCAVADVIDKAELHTRAIEAGQVAHEPSENDPIMYFNIPEKARTRTIVPRSHNPEYGTPQRNVEDFIAWAREVGIADPDIFTPPDLVERKDDWAVLVGLFDLARLTRGLPVPPLVAMERQQALARVEVPTAVKGDAIDQVVTQVMTENPHFRMKRVAAGRYIFGQKVLLMRILHGSVMVRVGGGWEELRSYLVKHASRGHHRGAASEAEAAVEAIRQSAGGVGLHTTRTRVRPAFE
eukprot:m.232584 g.232584  ORF g.232584 m.232584 type:complete len:1689 (+) comp12383_c0_seq1:42-5108(+)